MTIYYNTNDEGGSELLASKEKAVKQEALIHGIFKKTNAGLSAEEVLNICNKNHDYPITSIHRSLANLTEKGHLIKTDKYKTSRYGKQAHTWELNNEKGFQHSFNF